MAFEKGNQHAAKSRAFDAALRRAIAQDDGKRLRQAAEQLLTLAAEGEQWAIGMLADRLDGKAQQSVTIERKSVQEMSLDELAGALAASLAGGGEASGAGSEQSPELH